MFMNSEGTLTLYEYAEGDAHAYRARLAMFVVIFLIAHLTL